MYSHIKQALTKTLLVATMFSAAGAVAETNTDDATLYCESLDYMRISFAFDTTVECTEIDAGTSDQDRFAQILEGFEAIGQAELDFIVDEMNDWVETGVLPYPIPSIFNTRTVYNVDRNFEAALSYLEQDFLGFVDEATITSSIKETRLNYSARKSNAERELGFK